ncbi:MAG: hypothetical protein ACI80K_004401 [Paracoccaceae bacterium]|jgi:hypothetical protein
MHRLTFVALALLAACSTTRGSDDQKLSGFLSDYSRMERKESGKATFWANQEFRVSDYDAMLIQEVEIWAANRRDSEGLVDEDAERLAVMFHEKTVEELEKQGWLIATEPGPRVAHLRLALTELDGANRFGSILTSIPYMTTPAIRLASAATDVHVFVGEASAELRLTDSTTGIVLAEAYDRRVGSHRLRNIGSTWGDVEDALDVFASRIAKGLAREPGR